MKVINWQTEEHEFGTTLSGFWGKVQIANVNYSNYSHTTSTSFFLANRFEMCNSIEDGQKMAEQKAAQWLKDRNIYLDDELSGFVRMARTYGKTPEQFLQAIINAEASWPTIR